MKPQEIDDGLVMRNACAEDFTALMEHFRVVHGTGINDLLKAMLKHHSGFSWQNSFIIAKPDSGEVVSCVILLQGKWSLGGISFPTVEMEAVGTLEPYRHRGHMHLLNDAFEKRAAELQPVIQTIAGIPYFYRIFGYEYSAALGGGYPISASFLPRLPEGEQEKVTFEQVDEKSFKEFVGYRDAHLFNKTWSPTWQRVIRPEDARYLIFEPSSGRQESLSFYLVKEQGKTVGVFLLSHAENAVNLVELYLDNHIHVDALLRFATSKAQVWGELPIRVAPPNQAQVMQLVRARSFADQIRRYAWYVKIPSITRFVETIGPLLSVRLKDTEFHNYTGKLTITDYREGYTLSFENGKFTGITECEEKNPRMYDLRMSRGALTRLLMGYETFDSISSHEPDAACAYVMQPLVRFLFQKVEANVDPEF